MTTARYRQLLTIVLVICTLSSTWQAAAAGSMPPAAPLDCTLEASGDLMELVEAITDEMPGAGSNGFVVPSEAEMAAWETIVGALARGDVAAACDRLADSGFPYQIYRYRDTGDAGRGYWLFRETSPISRGWGTVLVGAARHLRQIVVEVPHAGGELHTETQGLELLRGLRARALILPGTNRCANAGYSACRGTTTECSAVPEPFRESDVAHSTQTMFQASHRALVPRNTSAVAVQLHGCNSPACPDLFISNGTCTPGDNTARLYQQALQACGPDLTVDVADCGAGECPLRGETNIQVRYSNGCPGVPSYDPCTACAEPPAPPSPEQVIHLEQSHRLRDDSACLLSALKASFPVFCYLPQCQRLLTRPAGAPRAAEIASQSAAADLPASPVYTSRWGQMQAERQYQLHSR